MSQQSNSQARHRSGANTLPPFVDRLVQGLSSRYLLFALGGLFVLDVVTPDLVPMVDEIILGLATLLLARWQSRVKREARQGDGGFGPKPPPKDVTPQP